MNRRSFCSYAAGTLALTALTSSILLSQQQPQKTEKPPPLDRDLVQAFVGAGHNDLPAVQEMLAATPNLLYATWDWGGGDFETALKGAGHVGRADIAEFLISRGARPNVFVLTMLGKTDVVKTLLDLYPNLLNSKGPHGFTLLHHAIRGEERSTELLEYLKGKGLAEAKLPII